MGAVGAAFFFAITAAHAKPNILLLIGDDCTRFDLGCYGSKDSRTPTIDKLAKEGMRFTRCYQAAPICSPTRHNLYTGMYPTRTGAYPNHTFADSNVVSVVQRLEPLGYRVALAGKRHIGPKSVFPFEYLDGDTGDGDGPGPDFDAVDAFLGDAAGKKQPFCLFLASHFPHSAWTKGDRSAIDENAITLPPHYVDNAATRRNYRDYLAEVHELDSQLKSALALLDKHGLADSTVVAFTSEQGTSMPFAKWTCYNAGLGSALIVRWPGKVAPGGVSDALVEYSDVVPTFIDIAGGKAAPGLDGSSLVPVLKGQATRHKEYSHGLMTTRGIFGGSEYFPIRSINDGAWRLIANFAPEIEFRNNSEMPGWEAAAMTDPFAAERVQRYRHRPAFELYDDAGDPWNLENLADDPRYDSIRTRLAGKLSEWMTYADDDAIRNELTAFEHMDKAPFNGDSVTVLRALSPASRLRNVSPGVRYSLYNGDWTSLPEFAGLTPARTGTVPDFASTGSLPGKAGPRYAVRYSAFVQAKVGGFHTFYLNSTHPARIRIDGKSVVGKEGISTRKSMPRRYGCIPLDSGRHAIEVDFLGGSANDSLSVGWSYPGLIEAVGNLQIPAGALVSGDPVSAIGGGRSDFGEGDFRMLGRELLVPASLLAAEIRVADLRGRVQLRSRGSDRLDLPNLAMGAYSVQAWADGRCLAVGRIFKH